jgi:hypothetical protein
MKLTEYFFVYDRPLFEELLFKSTFYKNLVVATQG